MSEPTVMWRKVSRAARHVFHVCEPEVGRSIAVVKRKLRLRVARRLARCIGLPLDVMRHRRLRGKR